MLYVCARGWGHTQKKHCRAVPWLRSFIQRLTAPPPLGHESLWWCIHSGEGNDAYGKYKGPLQMTTPWEGLSRDWYGLPVRTVFAIAEKKYREHGYSLAWIRQQWPQTSLSCI